MQEHGIDVGERTVCVAEAGDLEGHAVFCLHGTPGSRLFWHEVVEDAGKRGIRLIAYDRPGYGGSDPDPGPNGGGCGRRHRRDRGCPRRRALCRLRRLGWRAARARERGSPGARRCGSGSRQRGSLGRRRPRLARRHGPGQPRRVRRHPRGRGAAAALPGGAARGDARRLTGGDRRVTRLAPLPARPGLPHR